MLKDLSTQNDFSIKIIELQGKKRISPEKQKEPYILIWYM